MLTFYRRKKALLPALAAPQDLMMLSQIEAFALIDEKAARKQKKLVIDFHQANYISTLGTCLFLVMTFFWLWNVIQEMISRSKDILTLMVLLACTAAGIPFCYFVRILAMWSIRRRFEKLSRQDG